MGVGGGVIFFNNSSRDRPLPAGCGGRFSPILFLQFEVSDSYPLLLLTQSIRFRKIHPSTASLCVSHPRARFNRRRSNVLEPFVNHHRKTLSSIGNNSSRPHSPNPHLFRSSFISQLFDLWRRLSKASWRPERTKAGTSAISSQSPSSLAPSPPVTASPCRTLSYSAVPPPSFKLHVHRSNASSSS